VVASDHHRGNACFFRGGNGVCGFRAHRILNAHKTEEGEIL